MVHKAFVLIIMVLMEHPLKVCLEQLNMILKNRLLITKQSVQGNDAQETCQTIQLKLNG